MARVARLVTKREREHRAAANTAADVLRDIPEQLWLELPRPARKLLTEARRALRKYAERDEAIWPGGYSMIGRLKAYEVWKKIQALPPEARPKQVRDAFMFVLLCLDKDTGEVALSRQELADEIGCAVSNVSTIMGQLEKFGVVRRERQAEPGLRGRGRVVYVIDANVGWNGDLEFRRRAAAKQRKPAERQPALRLVQPTEAAE